MDAGKFFYAGVVADQAILDCYRLAEFYGRDPDDFLNKPLSAIRRHRFWTAKLIETRQPQDDFDA
jgi:hypothetical protein